MGHHISGLSNSAKRRQAIAKDQNNSNGEAGMLASLADAGTAGLHAVQNRISHLYCAGKDKAMALEHDVEEKIQHRPIASVLVALGLGALIGAISTFACKRR